MVQERVFKTVRLGYDNHFNEVLEKFFSYGWAVAYMVSPDYERGQIYRYITFVSGSDSKMPSIDYANAKLL